MKFLLSTAAIAAMALVPASASAQFLGLDNNTVVSGTIGAGLGGVIGSQIAGSNNRTEGAALGALAGGLAGAAYGNSQSSYYGNPYAGQFNPGFNGRNLAGTTIGAGLGGVIGSNLAGSGQRQEGTAIGAVLGGAAGYALANDAQTHVTGLVLSPITDPAVMALMDIQVADIQAADMLVVVTHLAAVTALLLDMAHPLTVCPSLRDRHMFQAVMLLDLSCP